MGDEALGADGAEVRNEVSGTVAGSVVQAGSISGGVHVHPPTPQQVVPRQLPAAVRHFAGRASELAALTTLLDEAAGSGGAVVISAIDGTAGIGKTALAVRWAHQAAERFPDGQLYVNLRGFDPTGQPMEPAEAVRGFLDALAVPVERIPASLEAQAGLYRSLLAGKRMLVVLDNARDADQVRSLLPGSPTCLVVVTSRDQLFGLAAAGAHRLTLDLLTPGEAHDLLARHLGRDRVAGEPDAVAELVELCARLPLALTIVAARAAAQPRFPLSALADELRDEHGRLDALDGRDLATNPRAVFSWSCQHLDLEAARMFRLLGIHPGPDISVPAAASLAGLSLGQARRVTGDLTRLHLIAEHAPGRFTFHDLLRAYAADQAHHLDPEAERRAALLRVLDHYLHTAHAADRLLYPHRPPITVAPPGPGTGPENLADQAAASDWFTTERPVLLAATTRAHHAGFDTHAWQLPWTLLTFLDRDGHWHDLAATHRVALAAAQRLGDQGGQAHAHRGIGVASALFADYDDAHTHLQHAVTLFEQAGDRIGQAATHDYLGWVCGRQHRLPEGAGYAEQGLGHAEQAFALYQAAGYQAGQADALHAIGWSHAEMGNYEQALSYSQRALALHRDLGDPAGEADTLDCLGFTHFHLGDYERALVYHQQAIDLFRDLGHRYGEADTLTRLAEAHHAAGDLDTALRTWRQALDILDELDHPDAEHLRARLVRLDAAPASTPSDGVS